MALFAFTYHQVMHGYLDFIFPFGDQLYAQDFHFSGFRHEDQLSDINRGLSVPELARSGRGLQLCYNLKSAEVAINQPQRPWSIRQTAVYHSFDIETGRTVWIMTKGNNMIRDRIMETTTPGRHSELAQFQSTSHAFASSLAVHLILCEWASENWRWRINALEEEFQSKTRHMLRARVDRSPSPPATLEKPERSRTAPLLPRRTATSFRGEVLIKMVQRALTLNVIPSTDAKPTYDSTPAAPLEPSTRSRRLNQPEFSFSTLQQIQCLEEKTNESLLILKLNNKVLLELRQYYSSIVGLNDCSNEIKVNCEGDVNRFSMRVLHVMDDMQMQQSRLEMLLRLLADRKALVCYRIYDRISH